MLTKAAGIYAARIVPESNPTKPIAAVGPANIQMNKDTNEFVVSIPGPLEGIFYNDEDPRMLEIWVRDKNPDKIAYSVPSNERI